MRAPLLSSAMALCAKKALAGTILFTLSTTGSWTVPSGWNNANNSIDCGGGGGTGAYSLGGTQAGSGGGGGQWAEATNVSLTPGEPIVLVVAQTSNTGDIFSIACQTSSPTNCNETSQTNLIVYATGGGPALVTGGGYTSTAGPGGGTWKTSAETPSNCPTDGVTVCGYGPAGLIDGNNGGLGATGTGGQGGAGGGASAAPAPYGGLGGIGGVCTDVSGTWKPLPPQGPGQPGNNYGGGSGGMCNASSGWGGATQNYGAAGYCRVFSQGTPIGCEGVAGCVVVNSPNAQQVIWFP